MASADVLASVLEDFSPVLTETFMKKHPLLNAIFRDKRIKQVPLGGTKRTFAVYVDGPGTANRIVTGNELINGGRKTIGHKGELAATRIIYAYDIPNLDLDQANGKQDIVELLKRYPEAGIADLQNDISKQIASGNGSTGVGGITTLNGEKTFTPETSALDGSLQAVAKASQQNSIFGLMNEDGTSGVTGWYNQFQDITGFGGFGLKMMCKVYFACERQGNVFGAPDLVFADEESYLTYLTNLDAFVQAPVGIDNDVINQSAKESVAFHGARVYLDDDIDVSQWTTNGDEGVMYFLNSKTWEFFHHSHNPHDKGGPNIFRNRKPFRHPTQDMMRFEQVFHGNLYCNSLRSNGVVTGGNNA